MAHKLHKNLANASYWQCELDSVDCLYRAKCEGVTFHCLLPGFELSTVFVCCFESLREWLCDSVLQKQCTVHYSLYTVQYSPFIVYRAEFTLHYIPCNAHCSKCILTFISRQRGQEMLAGRPFWTYEHYFTLFYTSLH